MSSAVHATAKPFNPTWTLILACFGAFMAALDVVVVSTALPTLQAHLHASLSDLEWTINAYNLVFACLILTASALGDRFGRRLFYALGMVVFSAASVGAALSNTAGELILARVIEGAGAAAVLPLSLTLIFAAFPPEKLGGAIGIWGGVTGLGASTGPVLGGVLIQNASWQWIFWINVPVGLLVAVFSLRTMRESRGPRPQLDPVGLLLVGAGMFGLAWAAVRAPGVGWGSSQVLTGLIGGAAFVAVFLLWERRARYPMVPLAYFRVRAFTTANGVVFFVWMSMVGALFLLTQLLQVGMGYGPMGAGVRMLAWVGTPLVVAPAAGMLSQRFGNKPFMLFGALLQGVGLIWLATMIKPGVGYPSLVAPLIVAGIGGAMAFPTIANAVAGSVPMQDSGVASGTNSALRELGGVFGVAIVAAVFAAHGGYGSRPVFMHGVRPAFFAAGGVSLLGALWALWAPSRSAIAAAAGTAVAGQEPALAAAGSTD
ncbi:MAG TPA: MFS transporter [Actinocrinis sp.]|nr:MFS transporter [Actinocrinis sp.]